MALIKEILEVLRRVKVRSRPSVLVCPVCGSRRIIQISTGITPTRYVCEDCGYTGYLVVEIEEG